MIKKIISLTTLSFILVVSIVLIPFINDSGVYSVYAYSGGSPGGKTNSPGDNSNCTQCHSGTINAGSGIPSITINGNVSSYVPGQTYTITGTISQNIINKFGFEITAEKDLDNSKVGTYIITNSTRTRLTTSNNSVTHQVAGTSASSSNSWSFDWIAPVAGTGNITLYGAFNAANGNGGSSGDRIYSTALNLTENTGVGLNELNELPEIKIFPNPTNGFVQIETDKKVKNLKVFNDLGEQVSDIYIQDNKIDVRKLKTGLYFLQFSIDEKRFNRRFIKKQ